ncbi:MAG: Coenzyme F420 hydrogenase/dehydrogenase, beta subunit C-terminal domain [Bdellovibrionales bacterium]|nr:Coenzyme F420 hydrogenase/dehydrogenase, beta subunit C-terminal domain [Bdellovibrionales bacterium]
MCRILTLNRYWTVYLGTVQPVWCRSIQKHEHIGERAISLAKKSLTILSNQAPLRSAGPFLDVMDLPADGEQGPPRALRGLARIIEDGLCHRCGSCVGICPTNVLALDSREYPTVHNLSACTDCDLCVKVCPGDEFDYHRFHQEVFGAAGDLPDTHGHFTSAVISHSNDVALREGSTSGGLVSAILIDLLERGAINGAVVTVSDEEKLWKGRPAIARSKAEVLAACKSKYAISPTNRMLREIRENEGRYAVVGLPCQIHGIQKAAALDPRIKERVVLTIGLFCHAAIEHEAFEVIWDSLGEKAQGARRFISRIGKHPGAPHLELADGSLYPVYFGNKKGFRPSSMEMINVLYRLYTPARCLTCFDGLADFADIAVGDPWMAPPDEHTDFYKGWSFALIRSDRGAEVFEQLASTNSVTVKQIERKEALKCNHHMASEKRWRAFRVIETLRRQGKSIPSYGDYPFEVPSHSGMQFVRTEGNILTHICCFLPSVRKGILRFFLGNGGYSILWMNNKRRRLKFWIRDTKAALLRRFKS